MTDKIAVCECGSPLIHTMVIPGRELLCMECGQTYGMFEADMTDATNTIETEQKWHKQRMLELTSACIPPGSYRADCEKCQRRNEYHSGHATADEMKASNEAYGAISRIGYNA